MCLSLGVLGMGWSGTAVKAELERLKAKNADLELQLKYFLGLPNRLHLLIIAVQHR